jgi:hypothetical protein
MPKMTDYYWNADDSHAAVVKGSAAAFPSPTLIASDDGYGGSNWEFSAAGLVVHVHFQGVSRRVSVVRIKTCDGANYDENIIKVVAGKQGVNLKALGKWCEGGYPNHATFLGKLHAAVNA